MNKDKIVEQIVNQWVKLAEKDLLAAKLILKNGVLPNCFVKLKIQSTFPD